MKTPAIIVLGSVNVDLVVRSARLPAAGETVIGGEFYQAAGGKGANQAVAAARAGRAPVVFLAAVGDDRFGQEMRSHFARENLVCDYIKTVPGSTTGVALILVSHDGENAIGVASGANLALLPEDVRAVPDEAFRQAGAFLANLESPIETVVEGLRRAGGAGAITILNPAPATPLGPRTPFLNDTESNSSGRFAGVDVLTPNAGEARLLTGVETDTEDGAVRAARRLQEQGCRAVVVTRGAEGCVVVTETVDVLEAFPVTAVDATAAGDAFNGALAVALSEGKSLCDAARWASRAAALAVSRRGAQPSLPTREEIESF